MGKIIVLTFNDSEEEIVNQLLDRLAENEFQLADMTSDSPLRFENLILYPKAYRVEIDGKSQTLSRRQFAMLHLLARSGGQILSKEQLYSHVWDDHVPINVDETIRYHISEIRKKLSELSGVDCIETVWGIGYRFREDGEEK